jgi:hypothetical protein
MSKNPDIKSYQIAVHRKYDAIVSVHPNLELYNA